MFRRVKSVKRLKIEFFLMVAIPLLIAAALCICKLNGWNLAYYQWMQDLLYRSNPRLSSRYESINRDFFNNMVFAGTLFFCCAVIQFSLMSYPAQINKREKDDEILRNRLKIYGLVRGKGNLSAEEFLQTRATLSRLSSANSDEFTGVYVLHNETKDMYYVGQSVRVLQRVTQHLTGHGNGDVYADFKYGDRFTVACVPLVESGYQSLNDLERDMIAAYDAYNSGYNSTRGNAR